MDIDNDTTNQNSSSIANNTNGSDAMAGAAGATSAAADSQYSQDMEDRLIDEEYKIWKKNTPFLYDYVMTHSLEWPSLTCQWLPPYKILSETAVEHQLLIGTHTSGEQNYLMVASCVLPRPQHLTDPNKAAAGGAGAAAGAATAAGEPSGNGKARLYGNNNNKSASSAAAATMPAPEFNEEKGEMGGFGLAPHGATVGKINIHFKLMHEGEVNRARCMPQNHFIVASRGPQPEVYIWDRTRHDSEPPPNSHFSPNGVCVGHSREGYGMVWSPHQAGLLATAADDQTVRLWDVNHIGKQQQQQQSKQPTATGKSPGEQVTPLCTMKGHADTVEDVDWHGKDASLLVSVGNDACINLWDMKNPTKPHFVVQQAHSSDINSVAFNPNSEYVFATGSSDQTVGIWDVRRLSQKLHSLAGVHTDDVFSLEWAPHDHAILASCSADRRVAIWDLARAGTEQSPEDAQDGPPELLFLHGGHTGKVSDLHWNPHAPWTLCTTSEDNVFQIWTMAEEIYKTKSPFGREEGEDDDDGADKDEDMGLGRGELE